MEGAPLTLRRLEWLVAAAALAGCGAAKHAAPATVVDAGQAPTPALPARLLPNAVDGTGKSARFFAPEGLAWDGHGNLFVADTGNHTIRKVVVATGAVTTIAGSPGEKGSVDGTGAQARFRGPTGLASDGAGNLFVSEGFDIRKVEVATGVVTTVAGSPDFRGSSDGNGAGASFSYPRGLAYDGAGNLYVADSGNNRTIRKVVVATGAVTTIAGSPGVGSFAGSVDGTGAAAGFTSPRALACDGHGNLFVAEDGSNSIRWVVLASGAVTTLAGSRSGNSGSANGTGTAATFYHPAGLAWDGAGDLLVADELNAEVRKIVVATGAVTTLVGSPGMPGYADGPAASATFAHPVGLASDGAGHLFVAETLNNTIRAVALATGAVTTLAGAPPSAHPIAPTAAAIPTAGPVAPPGAAGLALAGPAGLVAGGAGNLFVALQNDGTIREVTTATAEITTLAGAPGQRSVADGIGPAARFAAPGGLAYDGHGNLFVADGQTIRKVITSLGVVTTVAGKAGAAGNKDGKGAGARFETLAALASDGAGHLYAASGNTIRKIAVATGAVTTVAGSARAGFKDGKGAAARFNRPDGLACDGAGHLYVAEAGNNTLRKIDLSSRKVTTLAGSAKPPKRRRGHAPPQGRSDGAGLGARFVEPAALAWAGAGQLLVVERGAIRKVAVATRVVTTLSTAHLERAGGIAADGAGNAFVTDRGEGVIRRVVLGSGASTVLPLRPGRER